MIETEAPPSPDDEKQPDLKTAVFAVLKTLRTNEGIKEYLCMKGFDVWAIWLYGLAKESNSFLLNFLSIIVTSFAVQDALPRLMGYKLEYDFSDFPGFSFIITLVPADGKTYKDIVPALVQAWKTGETQS